jgi:hypothetical protein
MYILYEPPNLIPANISGLYSTIALLGEAIGNIPLSGSVFRSGQYFHP